MPVTQSQSSLVTSLTAMLTCRHLEGMDLNPVFTAATSFHPAGAGGELKLFEQVGIKLVHGWVVDPDSEEANVVGKTADYDSAVNLIAEADHTTNGHLVQCEDSFGAGGSAPNGHVPKTLTEEEREKVTRGTVIISRTNPISQRSHPPYHSHHSQQLPAQHPISTDLPRPLHTRIHPRTWRTRRPLPQLAYSHLSVLYKSKGENSSLYTLVSDHVSLHEPDVVRERLEHIDGGCSMFVDSDFVRSSPVGGDFAGQTAESTLRAMEAHGSSRGEHAEYACGAFFFLLLICFVLRCTSQALARQLQAEEDELARRSYARWERERQEARRRQEAATAAAAAAATMGYNMPDPEQTQVQRPDQRKKPKRQCII